MPTLWIDKLIWPFIYVGMAVMAIGIAMTGSAPTAGYAVAVSGGAAVLAGVVLVFVRSRMADAPPQAPSSPAPKGRP